MRTASILSGAALAAVAGILLGGAMRPQLIFDGRPLGPQMFANGGGVRSTGPFDARSSYAAYGSNLPAYVTGTDFVQAAYAEPAPAAEPRPQLEHNEDAAPAPMAMTRAAYDEPPPPITVVYPSLAGGSAYAKTPEPPPPPHDEAPTITG